MDNLKSKVYIMYKVLCGASLQNRIKHKNGEAPQRTYCAEPLSYVDCIGRSLGIKTKFEGFSQSDCEDFAKATEEFNIPIVIMVRRIVILIQIIAHKTDLSS